MWKRASLLRALSVIVKCGAREVEEGKGQTHDSNQITLSHLAPPGVPLWREKMALAGQLIQALAQWSQLCAGDRNPSMAYCCIWWKTKWLIATPHPPTPTPENIDHVRSLWVTRLALASSKPHYPPLTGSLFSSFFSLNVAGWVSSMFLFFKLLVQLFIISD